MNRPRIHTCGFYFSRGFVARFRGYAAPAPGSTKPPCYAGYSCACTYAYVVALTSENGLDISTSISTRPWTNHRSLSPRLLADISNAIWPWRTLRPPSCLSFGRGELVSRIESNMPFFACVCPYAYALAKTRLNGLHTTYWLKILAFKFLDCLAAWRPNVMND